jgi:hypothetical protein
MGHPIGFGLVVEKGLEFVVGWMCRCPSTALRSAQDDGFVAGMMPSSSTRDAVCLEVDEFIEEFCGELLGRDGL